MKNKNRVRAIRIGRGASLLCPFCKKVKRVLSQNEKDLCLMECLHLRTPGLLPSKNSNAVSVECLLSRDTAVIALAGRLFPLEKDIA